MSQKNIITEYSETEHHKKADLFQNNVFDNYVDDYISYAEDDDEEKDDEAIEFSEEEFEELDEQLDTLGDEVDEIIEELGEPLDPSEGDELSDVDVVEFAEPLDSDELEMVVKIPGSDVSMEDLEDDEKDKEEEVEEDWINDRNPGAFMSYILSCYPSGIPRHSGHSIVGAERAANFLNGLNKEISEAVRIDKDSVLDLEILEDIRVRIMNDLLTLKSLIKKLQKIVKDKHSKAADENDSLVKEATTPMIQLIMTPFERAMTGIIVNSVVSAGKPFDEVWSLLKKKYDWTDREEIALLQLIQDLGFHIFKDRGTVGEPKLDLDFIKNYFG